MTEVVREMNRLGVTAEEGAAMIGISRRCWFQWDSSGRLGPMPVLRIGRVVRWDASEIRAWWEAGAPARTKWLEMKKSATKN